MTQPTPLEIATILNAQRGGFTELIGLRFVSASLEEVVAEIDIDERHAQPYGLIHGGVHAAIVETLCSVGAGLHAFHDGKNVVGLDNHTSFLRACRGGKLTAKGVPVKTGRRSHVWRTDIFDEEGRMLATGQVRTMALDKDTPVAGKAVGDMA